MTQYQLLPYQRIAEVLNELAGLGISPGAVRVAATCLEAPVNAIRDALVAAPVAHADETSLRGNGNLYSAPTGLRPTSLSPNMVPRPWMGSAC